MVQRSPEARQVRVRKRDGRSVPFDQSRLFASIRHALEASGSEDPYLAADLGSVVEAYVGSHVQDGSITAEEIAGLVQQVMASAGCENGAYVYQRVREERDRARRGLRIRHHDGGDGVRAIPRAAVRSPDEWSKGRIVSMLETEAELDMEVAQDIAAEVERGLFASGVGSVSCGLVREWVDNELVKRGLRARLGQHHQISLSSHEVREILGAHPPGGAAEAETAGSLLARYALREVYPRAVVQAHERGRIALDGLPYAGRIDAVTVPTSALSGEGGSLARIAGRVRQLRQLCSREVCLVWDGDGTGSARDAAVDGILARGTTGPQDLGLADFLLGLTDGRRSGAEVVLCVDGAQQGLAFLEAFEALLSDAGVRRWDLPVLRLCAPGTTLEPAARIESVEARVQFAAALPRPGVVGSAVTLNLPRLVLDGGADGLALRFDQLVSLARSACRARSVLLERDGGALAEIAALLPGGGARRAPPPAARRLDLCGLAEALALATEGLPPDRRDDAAGELVAGFADALARHRTQSLVTETPGQVPEELVIGVAAREARRRLGRLDLVSHPNARERLSQAPARDGYRYDGPTEVGVGADAAHRGHRLGGWAARLGAPAAAPVPRSTGDTAARVAFVQAYFTAVSDWQDAPSRLEQPCA